MTNEEIKTELRRLFATFPSLASWLNKYDADTVSDGWCKQLYRMEQSDLAEVISGMIAGDVELPPAFEYDRIGLIIRRHCNELRKDRTARQREEARREQLPPASTEQQAHGVAVVAAMREAMKLGGQLRNGKLDQDQHDVKLAMIHARLPEPPEGVQPRYRCTLCRDRGLIAQQVELTNAHRTGEGHPYPARMIGKKIHCNGACSCSAGERYRQGRGPSGPSSGWKPLLLAEVIEQDVTKHANYRPEFQDWNDHNAGGPTQL